MRYVPLLLLAACADAFAPDGAQRLTPTPDYAAIWQQVESCAGMTRPFTDIQWFVVGDEDTESFPTDRGLASGWYASPDRIYLAGWSAFRDVRYRSVRHESLHAILRGDGDHQSPLWGVCT